MVLFNNGVIDPIVAITKINYSVGMLSKKIFIYPLLLSVWTLSSQVLVDSVSKAPVPYVEIFNNSKIGTISDEQGRFSLEMFNPTDSVFFKHLTYLNIEGTANEFYPKDTIFMGPQAIELNEVFINSFNARDSVKKAVLLAKKNHLTSTYKTMGFYREYVKEEGDGVFLAEASYVGSVENSKKGIDYQIKILEGKKTENLSTLGINLEGGPQRLFEMGDIIAQENLLFDKSKIDEFQFNLVAIKNKDGDKIYEINFEPITNNLENNLMGTIFLEAGNLSFVEFCAKRDPVKLRQLGKIVEARTKDKKSPAPNFNLVQSELMLRFRKESGKQILSFIKIFNQLMVPQKSKYFLIDINAATLITSISTNKNKSKQIIILSNHLDMNLTKCLKEFLGDLTTPYILGKPKKNSE